MSARKSGYDNKPKFQNIEPIVVEAHNLSGYDNS